MKEITVKLSTEFFRSRVLGPFSSLVEAKEAYETMRNLTGEGSRTFGFGKVFMGGSRTHTITYNGTIVEGVLQD